MSNTTKKHNSHELHVRRLWFYSLPTSQTNPALQCQILYTKKHTSHELHVRRLWCYSPPTSRENRALRCQILHTKSTTPMNSTSDACQTPVPHQTPVVQFPPDQPDKPCITVSPRDNNNNNNNNKNSHELHVRRLWFNSLPTTRTNRALRCPRGEVSLRPWVAEARHTRRW